MNNSVSGNFKDKRYFSSIRNYTLALLNSFNNIKYWVPDEENDNEREFTVPINFGNYEKSIALADINEQDITSLNFNFLPRLVLSFEGMSKNIERQTNKFQKYSQRVFNEQGDLSADVSFNSVSYDFHYTLLLQTRGLTIASQITEEMLVMFNPTLNLMIEEFPLFDHRTETQILVADPAFEILDEFSEEDVNIINVTFDITVRGNIYSPIGIEGPIKVVKMFVHLWDEKEYESSKLASYYRFDVDQVTRKVSKETLRSFDATQKTAPVIESIHEQDVIDTRPDYSKYQVELVPKETE